MKSVDKVSNGAANPLYSIRLENLTVQYGKNKVLDNITMHIPAGSFSAIIGPNGAGKTTILRALLRLIPYRGKIRFCQDEDCHCKPTIGYVPQRLAIDPGNPLTVEEFLLVNEQRRPLWLGYQHSARMKVHAALSRVGAEALAPKNLSALSGGESQRVLLAKALLKEPQILLYDEPVANIDMAGEELFCDLLEDLYKDSKFTVVMVSHDLSVVSRHADHVICINRSLICQGSVTEVITPENIQSIYGVHMGFHTHKGAH